jgi:predicted nucleotidyltransferase component of viral defense system
VDTTPQDQSRCRQGHLDGRDATVIDIAQDLLLRDLHERGTLDALVFKGGTSLPKP